MGMASPSITVTPEKFQLVLGVNDDITISVTNVGFDSIIYRILTTTPEHYVVKHTKGVVKGNSTAKISITLNPKHVLSAAEQQPECKVFKDDFKLEYAIQGPDDVIEPRASNVPQLIKDKKATKASNVLKKMLRCHVLLDATNAAATITDPSAGGTTVGAGESASRDHNIRMSAKEMHENTLLEKNKRCEMAPHSGNGRGGAAVTTVGDTTQRMKLLLIIAGVIAAGAIWMLME